MRAVDHVYYIDLPVVPPYSGFTVVFIRPVASSGDLLLGKQALYSTELREPITVIRSGFSKKASGSYWRALRQDVTGTRVLLLSLSMPRLLGPMP